MCQNQEKLKASLELLKQVDLDSSLVQGQPVELTKLTQDINEQVSRVAEQLFLKTQLVSDFQSVEILRAYMQTWAIGHVGFTSDYVSDNTNGGSMHLFTMVRFKDGSFNYALEDKDALMDAQCEIADMFAHRDPDTMDGLEVHWDNFDAFVQKLVGQKAFAAKEAQVLEQAAKSSHAPGSKVRV